MASRDTWRIPIRLNVELNFEGKTCAGTIMNLSESGMFISTDETEFTEDVRCDISIQLEKGSLHVPGKFVRSTRINGGCDGIGVQLLNPPQSYLDFVESLLFIL